jgi:hypothetical protein
MPYRVHYGLMRIEAALFLLVFLFCIIPASAQFTLNNEYCGDINLFFTNESSDIPGYYILDKIPRLGEQTIISKTVNSASGDVLIASFITPPGRPGVPVLMPGYTRYRTYHSVSTVGTTGENTVFFRFYNRSADGTETRIYYDDAQTQSDVDSLTLKEYTIAYAKRNYSTLFKGDRFVVKAYAKTTGGPDREIRMSLGGSTNASMVASGFYPCDEKFPEIPNLPAKEPGFFGEQIIVGGGLIALFLIYLVLRGK